MLKIHFDDFIDSMIKYFRYRYMDEDDECMESSFGQLEKEEKFSLIQGNM